VIGNGCTGDKHSKITPAMNKSMEMYDATKNQWYLTHSNFNCPTTVEKFEYFSAIKIPSQDAYLIFCTPQLTTLNSSYPSWGQIRDIPTNTQIFEFTYVSDSHIKTTKPKRLPSQLLHRRLVTNNVFFLNNGTKLLVLGGNNEVQYGGEYFDIDLNAPISQAARLNFRPLSRI
jgi:hypothetical protein